MTVSEDLLPREKLRTHGSQFLTDQELIAAMLGTGSKGDSVWNLSKRVLAVVDRTAKTELLAELIKIEGVGLAKACTLLSALEFSRRRIRPEGIKVRSATDVLPLIQHYAHRKQEHFICVSLNGAHEVIAVRVITIGLVNRSQVHPREVFADPLTDRATSIIVAHNHPSGDLTPSQADKEVTEVLHSAGKLLGIGLLDHIIFSRDQFWSFQEQGLLSG